jgi:hypothetical protein
MNLLISEIATRHEQMDRRSVWNTCDFLWAVGMLRRLVREWRQGQMELL